MTKEFYCKVKKGRVFFKTYLRAVGSSIELQNKDGRWRQLRDFEAIDSHKNDKGMWVKGSPFITV